MFVLLKNLQKVQVKGFGLTYVSLDLQGFRSGSMNESIK